MKKCIFIIFFIYINSSINAQDVTYDLLNRSLRENNLLETNMTAQNYNAAGMYFYEREMWVEAEAMFSQAVNLDREHILAPYNLACVMSIRLSKTPQKQEGRWYYWYNGILQEHISEDTVFGVLYHSVTIFNGYNGIMNPERMARARIDPDFDYLRNIDPEYFDAITLPEDQRTRYKYTGIYIKYNSFMNRNELVFSELGREYNKEKYWEDHWRIFSAWDEIFQENGFFHYDSISDRTVYNEEMLEKIFEIEYVYEPRHSGEISGHIMYKFEKAISINEI